MGVLAVATIIYAVLSIFIVIMFIRLVFDLVASFSRGWRPTSIWLVIAEAAYVVTDPPVKAVRRILPPMRIGGVVLDFAWSIVLVVAIILSYVALGFMN